MKKIILLLLLVLVSITASARKSYITVYCNDTDGYSSQIYLTGDAPNNIEGFEYDTNIHSWIYRPSIRKYTTGEILNMLSEYGYEVEFVNSCSGNSNTSTPSLSYVLSKETSSGQTIIQDILLLPIKRYFISCRVRPMIHMQRKPANYLRFSSVPHRISIRRNIRMIFPNSEKT